MFTCKKKKERKKEMLNLNVINLIKCANITFNIKCLLKDFITLIYFVNC